MFRDSHGVVHTVSSADPLLDLPADTAAALAAALLRPEETDLEAALDRCEAVRELLERWQDAFFAALPDDIDLEEEARWAAEAGLSLAELEAAYATDDDRTGAIEIDLDDIAPALDEPALVGMDPGPVGLDLDPPEPDELLALVPDELVQVLERELLLLPLRVRLEALVAAAALVGTWADLLADHEKLLGHLVLGHRDPVDPVDPVDTGHSRLAARHAALHARQGTGHSG